MYDNTALSVRAVVLAVLAMVGYFIFIFLCWLVYPRPHSDNTSDVDRDQGVETNGNMLPSTDTEDEDDEAVDGEGGERGRLAHTSVIGQMQNEMQDSRAQLLVLEEVGSRRNSSPSSGDTHL